MADKKAPAPPQVSPDYQRGLQEGMHATIGQAQILAQQAPPKIKGPGDRQGHYHLGLWEAAQKLLAESASHPAAPVAVAGQQMAQPSPEAAQPGGPQIDPQQLQQLMQQFFQPQGPQ